jgi:long-chain acyl-CoA synthetase
MDVRTIPELLQHSLRTHRKPDVFLIKQNGRWEPIPMTLVMGRIAAVSAALRERGIVAGDRVAILAESRLEWAIADMAILWIGAVTVPIYSSLPAGQVAPLFVDSGCVGAFVSTKEQRAKVESVRGQLPSLRWIWCFDEEALPEERRASVEPPETTVRPDDLATIIYTSGTTGVPKGVMLTHGNIAAEAVLALKAMAIRSTDVYLSLLPLSHIFERCSGLYTMLLGGTTIAYSESLERVSANILEVRPTIVMAVPRFYEKLLARIFEVSDAAGFPRANLARWGRGVAMEWARRQDAREPMPALLSLAHAIASKLVYSVIGRKLGGRLRLRVSGGAALQRDVALFFYGAGQPIFEGYGLTETSSAICVNRFDNFRIGTVGPLFDTIEVKFAEDGEILVRGPVVMKGYWNRAQDTAEAIRDGWFHTGDIGAMDPDGHLRITDRKKDLIVTSGGKKVAPQPIENALRSAQKVVREALVLGDGKKFVAALIVPAPGATREEIGAEVEKANSTLASFEKIKRFELIPDDLTIESGFLTPSLKLKRKAVAERHRDLIERLFEGA